MIAGLVTSALLVLASATPPGLPEARYDAVIAGLDGWSFTAPVATAYTLAGDAELFDSPGGTAIAVLMRTNFADSPTVVAVVDHVNGWSRVLTPARSALPSASGGSAPAQTTAWLPDAALTSPKALIDSVVISVSSRTLSIVRKGAPTQTFSVGVGAVDTPTPTGVTGYLQARYLDPAQGQDRYRVQLTSLHSAVADEPFGGSDGGLIGLHYERESSGNVSHGCVRLPAAALRAVDALPLGTLVSLLP